MAIECTDCINYIICRPKYMHVHCDCFDCEDFGIDCRTRNYEKDGCPARTLKRSEDNEK
jgi:hypothetical protein